jgi:site-specific recombinase XerD
LLCHLRSLGTTLPRANPLRPDVEQVVAEFDAYLVESCGLAAATRLYRRRYAWEFVHYVFGARRIEWQRLQHRHLHDFISQYGANGRTAAAQVAAVSLRSFLRWLQFQGRLDGDLVTAVPSFRRWRLASLPRVMSSEQLQSFLASFNRSDPSGCRDYAMALCMVELGLRVAEVANLQVGDVDFATRALHLSARKSRHASILPMPHRVYQAITAYIRKGRPKTDNSFLFVRHRIPKGAPVTRELIRSVMRRAYAAVPGCEEWTGTHPLRHTAATRWQRAGADLKQIADLLGHRCLDTTAIYAKVDLDRLAQVALPWPGEEARS